MQNEKRSQFIVNDKKPVSCVLLLLISAWIAGCSISPQPALDGEMLVQKMPLPAGQWEVQQISSELTPSIETRWTSSSGAVAQTIVTYEVRNVDVAALKNEDDNIGEQACEAGFSSKVLTEGIQNGYPQLTWRSLCQAVDGLTALVLHKVIVGNEAHYRFRRTFMKRPTKEEWLLWIDYVHQFIVCDLSHTLAHPCPADLEQTNK
ncbi:hypothetical protein [Alteromonas aquimaris]|nr:hypothetical protein [Alteromonas aquimaris]